MAPQVRAAAARRLNHSTALSQAKAELEAAGTPERDPLEHLEEALEQAAYQVALFRAVVRIYVDSGQELLTHNRHGEALIHPYQAELGQAEARHARVAKQALDAGVAQRRVEIKAQQAQILSDASRAVWAALGLSAELQQKGLAMLARELRQKPPPLIEG